MEANTELRCCIDQCNQALDATYWDAQYESQQIGWDLGGVSPALSAYFNQLANKEIAILIPGCGNTYEADALLELGFTDLTILDIAPKLVEKLRTKYEAHPQVKVVEADFFEHKGQYDLIVEQTFFCALNPALRSAYAQKMAELLRPNGKLVGLLFDKEFEHAGPPFGGCKCKYIGFFEPYFDFKVFEKSNNSHLVRNGMELFINFVKPNPSNP